MWSVAASKDRRTLKLRRTILHGSAAFLAETDRADLMLVTLSFQSLVKPERHAWIDTDQGHLGEQFSIDLEDWTHETTWDNAVATISTSNRIAARDVTWAWLGGESLDNVLTQAADSTVQRK